LNESYLTDFLVEFSLREGFEEIASGIFEDARFYDQYAINGGFDNVHNV
jgi:hypothetical protein